MESMQSGTGSVEIKPFVLRSVRELYAIPEESTRFSVENLLPTGGFSILVGKPKAGKTTFVRQLAVAVAQGQPFLGRQTEPGTVIYVALEEKVLEVVKHFRELGLSECDPLQVYCDPVDKSLAVAMLEQTLVANPGVKLVIIDPVFRFVKIKDANDYIQVNNALEPILELARKHDVHILVVHHQKKRESDDVIDGSLGSTAISGGVDTFITLRRAVGGVRTLCTRQRYGTDMDETQLQWDPETRQLTVGQTCEEAACNAANATAKRITGVFTVAALFAGFRSWV